LLSCGARRAIASWGNWSAQGRWVWAWKDWSDRRFVARYAQPAPAVEPALPAGAEREGDPTP